MRMKLLDKCATKRERGRWNATICVNFINDNFEIRRIELFNINLKGWWVKHLPKLINLILIFIMISINQ